MFNTFKKNYRLSDDKKLTTIIFDHTYLPVRQTMMGES